MLLSRALPCSFTVMALPPTRRRALLVLRRHIRAEKTLGAERRSCAFVRERILRYMYEAHRDGRVPVSPRILERIRDQVQLLRLLGAAATPPLHAAGIRRWLREVAEIFDEPQLT